MPHTEPRKVVAKLRGHADVTLNVYALGRGASGAGWSMSTDAEGQAGFGQYALIPA